MTDKHFNTDEYNKREKRNDMLMTMFVYAVLGFAFLGVMASFSFLINFIWRLLQ